MITQSLWNSFSSSTDFSPLNKNTEADVAIIGGGITGITTAHLLAGAGLNVIVLEARKVGGGTTAHSTGNLYFTVDKIFSSLQAKYDTETVVAVYQARSRAVDHIESLVREFSLDCDFERQPWYLYSADEENDSKIDDELETAIRAGIPIKEAAPSEFPFAVRKGVKADRQAQFNAMRYVQELAKTIQSRNCRICENTRVTDVTEEKDHTIVETTGGQVKARFVVHATHTPKGKMVSFQTVLGPYREYGVAAKLASGNYPEGIFWGYHGQGDKYSVRSYKRGEDAFVLAVGQPHKVGQANDNIHHIRNLENFLLEHFDIAQVTHRWGGQHYRPADLLPYIGRKAKDSPVFVATGFSTDGLIYGTLSAMIISDLITGKKNEYAHLFDASRHQPLKAAQKFVKENLNVAAQYLKDLPPLKDSGEFEDIANGEGKVLEKDGHKLAAYRDRQGNLQVRSAVCTHMACIVHWNNAEETWDCPCHGSRFDTDGSVLEGPAFHPLHDIEFDGDKVKSRHRE